MADLVYSAIASLDGYIEDADGEFGWAEPSEEVHAFVNDRMRPIGTHLYGRRMYETMLYWETAPTGDQTPLVDVDFTRIWQAADKVVFSRTLTEPFTARTRIEPELDLGLVRDLKAMADRPLIIGGPEVAAPVLAAGLVDELEIYVTPIVVGGGKRTLPDGLRLPLELVEQRRFDNGTVFLRYRTG